MGKASRDKGARFEREVAGLFREHGYDVQRGGAMHVSGAISPDVYGAPGIHIECKRYANLFGKAYDFLAQASADSKKDEIPVVFYRADNCPPIVFPLYRSWEVDR